MKQIALIGLIVAAGAVNANVLYDNGRAVNSLGRSALKPPSSSYGFGAQTSVDNAVADDFVVTGNGWSVQSVDLFSYQTGAGASNFTFTDATWSIVSGDVNTGTVVASGTTSVGNGGFVGYRVTTTTRFNKDRAIFDVQVDIPDVDLTAGHYWLTYSLNGSAAFSGPWIPPTFDRRQGNAQQSITGSSFSNLVDSGSGRTVDLPFVLNGTFAAASTVAAVPEPATAASLLVGLAFLMASRSRARGSRP